MNILIELLNQWGDRGQTLALSQWVQSSVLIAGLLLLDLALRRRLRAVVRYTLWLLVLVKLVLPPSLALPTGIGYWLRRPTAKPVVRAEPKPFVVRFTEFPRNLPPARAPFAMPAPTLQSSAVGLLVWLGGVAGLLAVVVRRSKVVQRTVREAVPAPEQFNLLLEQCQADFGIRRRVQLRLAPHAMSPAVYGLWRPVVLVPQELADRLPLLQLRAVLLHELAHLKRGDVWVNHAQTALQMLYWWHPLVWLANARIRRVREQAVDESVMVSLGTDAECYPSALLKVARLCLARPRMSLGLVGIVESRTVLKQRVQRLLDCPAPRTAKLGTTGLLMTLCCAALLLPMARGEKKAPENRRAADLPLVAQFQLRVFQHTDPLQQVQSNLADSQQDQEQRLPEAKDGRDGGRRPEARPSADRQGVGAETLRHSPAEGLEEAGAKTVVREEGKEGGQAGAKLAELQTRIYKVQPGRFLEVLRQCYGSAGRQLLSREAEDSPKGVDGEPLFLSVEETSEVQAALRAALREAGVRLDHPKALFFNERTGVLMLKATLPELERAEGVIERLDAPLQTRIFKVDPAIFGEVVGSFWPTQPAPRPFSTDPATPMLAQGNRPQPFEDCGARPASFAYTYGGGRLLVTATAADLELIEKAIQEREVSPPKSSIEQ